MTKEGENHIDEIIESFFYYFKILKDSGVKKWIFDECKDLAEIAFRFREKREVSQFTSSLASSMPKYKPEHM